MARGKKSREKKPRKAKAPVAVEWERLSLVEKIVDEVVADHHPHLARARIIVLGKPKAGTRGQSTVVATASRAPKNVAALYKDASGLDVHYLITIGRSAWDELSAEQKIVIDHKCCHFLGLDDKGRWALRADHDVEEFHEIIKRHGEKLPALQGVLRIARQMALPLPEAPQE
jgi:predicted metallopeptidase